MGYYCDVTIRCRKGAYEELRDLWQNKGFPKPDVIRVDEDYYIQWSDIKWYSNWLEKEQSPDEVISSILEVFDYIDIVERPEMGYSMYVIGEDPTDVEYRYNDADVQLQLIRKVEIPSDGEVLIS